MAGSMTRGRAGSGATTLTRQRRRFNVDEYHQLDRAGVLGEDQRVELIEGDIIQMSPIGERHVGCTIFLGRWFTIHLGERAFVSIQNPVRITEHDEPQPDVVLLRPRADGYRSALPRGEDVLLLIEVCDTSLTYGRDVKLPLFARAGITEVWLADLGRDRLLVNRDPHDGHYRTTSTHTRRGSIAPLAFPDLVVRCAEILG